MGETTGSLRVRIIDPDRDRQEAEQLVAEFGLAGRELADGVVLVRSGQGPGLKKTHLLPGDLVTYATGADVQATGPRVKEFRGEEALLGAFLRVTDPQRSTACVTAGHGEPALDNLEPFGGYAHLADLLRDAGVLVEVADLEGGDGLSGCDVVVVAGPRGALPAAHVRAIAHHADAGGHLLVLSGAVILRGKQGLAHHGLEDLLAGYGIRFADRVVVDPHPMPGGTPYLSFTLSEGWGGHPAVQSLVGRAVSMVFVRELEVGPTPDADAQVLLDTSADGWAEANLAAIVAGEPPQFEEGPDRRGPIPLVAAAERGGSRVVVIASDQFALNAYLREDVVYDHGRDLVLNAVGWLTSRAALMGVRARQREHVKLVLLPSQLRRMTLICLLGLPGFGILLGFWVLWRRRR